MAKSTISRQRDLVLAAMLNQDRAPFAEAVTKALCNGPHAADWRKLAHDAPDKWARSITELGKLAGFTERQEVRHNVAVAVVHMSDAAIMQRLAELQAELAGTAAGALAGAAQAVPSPPTRTGGRFVEGEKA